jgi:hypothetical protein
MSSNIIKDVYLYSDRGVVVNTRYLPNIEVDTSNMVMKGYIDCSAFPDYPTAKKGESYVVSRDGIIGGASGLPVYKDDMIFCIRDYDKLLISDPKTCWNIIPKIATGGGSGNVTGPSSSVNNNIAVFNGTDGKAIKDSGIAVTNTLSATPSANKIPTEEAIAPLIQNMKTVTTHDGMLSVTDVTLQIHCTTVESIISNSILSSIVSSGSIIKRIVVDTSIAYPAKPSVTINFYNGGVSVGSLPMNVDLTIVDKFISESFFKFTSGIDEIRATFSQVDTAGVCDIYLDISRAPIDQSFLDEMQSN